MHMQTEKRQLLRQQFILKGLGFYKGKLDGVWGPASIEAMKNFEANPLFLPGLPKHGLPMSNSKPFPAGITLDVSYSGLLYHPCMELLLNEEKQAWDAICNPVIKVKSGKKAISEEPEE